MGQHDGVQLGSHHERGEQHRGSQCAHHALLLQTGASVHTAIKYLLHACFGGFFLSPGHSEPETFVYIRIITF